MKTFLRIFLLGMVLYHVAHTVIGYGWGGIDPFVLSSIKDVFWILMVCRGVVLGWKLLPRFIQNWKRSLICLSVLIIWSVVVSIMQGISLEMILVGLKYDIYPLVIFVSSIFLGHTLFGLSGINYNTITYETLAKMSNLFLYVCILILVGGIVWQLAKVIYPEVFYWLGYGSVGDYVLGSNPPIWYRTGPGGMMRLQGLFSGPNNYGFFLVSMSSVVLGFFSSKTPTHDVVGVAPCKGGLGLSAKFLLALYLTSVIWTLSRGAWIGVSVQVFFLIRLFRPQRKKYLGRLVIIGLVGLVAVAQIKSGSTMAHIAARFEGRDAFLAHPWGYGLASAGPGIHWDGVYLPENHYLQLLLDIGLPGLVMWFGVLGSIGRTVWSMKNKIQPEALTLILLFSLGLFGLLIEGLFLHVFEDSMVNYLFFVPFGILLGNSIST